MWASVLASLLALLRQLADMFERRRAGLAKTDHAKLREKAAAYDRLVDAVNARESVRVEQQNHLRGAENRDDPGCGVDPSRLRPDRYRRN